MDEKIYVSHWYEIKEYADMQSALDGIKAELDKNGLSYTKVYEHTENNMTVLVYQYWTLYTECFIIHYDYDLRR